MRVLTPLRGALAALALLGLAGCGDDNSGPSCVPVVVDQIFVDFPIFAPGASVAFAEAQLRQAFFDYADAGCGAPFTETYLRFQPLASFAVRFGYRLDFFRPSGAGWFYEGDVRLLGGPEPTNEVFVSSSAFPIDQGSFELVFTFFTPL